VRSHVCVCMYACVSLRCAAVCCSVLLCVAVCCGVLGNAPGALKCVKSIGLSFAKEPYKRDDILQQVTYI